MSLSIQYGAAPVDLTPRDKEYEQNKVTVPHGMDIDVMQQLRGGASANEYQIYGLGADADHDLRRSEIAYTVRRPENSLAYTNGAFVNRSRRIQSTVASLGVANQITEHHEKVLTSLCGWSLPASTGSSQPVSEEEERAAIMNSIHIVGVIDKDLKRVDGASGALCQTIIGGTTYMFADTTLPPGTIVQATVPLRSEAQKHKFKRTGLNPSKVGLIAAPVRANSLSNMILTHVGWYLRDPKQFMRVMNPKISGTQTWAAVCQAQQNLVTSSVVAGLDWIGRQRVAPTWPLNEQGNEMDDGDVYLRSQNEAAHMFYVRAGFIDGQAITNVAQKVRKMHSDLRKQPSLVAEAFAVVSDFVKLVDATTVGAPALATIDERTRSFFSAAEDRPAFMQNVAQSALGTLDTIDSIFGTVARSANANRFIDQKTGYAMGMLPGGQIIARQANAYQEFIGSIWTAYLTHSSHVMGVVTKGAKAGEMCTVNLSKVVN